MIWYNFKTIFFYILLIALNSLILKSHLISFILLLFLFRKLMYIYRVGSHRSISVTEFQNGPVYAPVNGRVEKVLERENEKVIICGASLILPSAICFPISGEITQFMTAKDFKHHSFFLNKCVRLEMRGESLFIKILIKMNSFQAFNKILRAGDFGYSGSLFSEMPNFSKVEIILPKDIKINVNAGEKIRIGRTPLASWE